MELIYIRVICILPLWGFPPFGGPLSWIPWFFGSRPRSKWHLWWMLEERWYRMRHGARCTLCIISCANDTIPNIFSRGANSNPEGWWIDTSLGTSFRFFFGRSGSICTQVYMYTYTVHIMTMIHRSDPCFVCLSISIFKTDWANPSQEVEDPKSFLARGQSCKRKPGEKMCEKLGEWIGIHSQLWIPF